MTRSHFLQQLEELKGKLLTMGGMAERATENAVRAYSERNLSLCREVLDRESDINLAERQIDELAFDLLAMQQPMAIDLRFILAVIKINADLERVGDQAVNIVERVMTLVELESAELDADIPAMAATAREMVRLALEAFISGNADIAQRVLGMDDLVDRMNRDTHLAMERTMRTNPQVTRQALGTVIIARNLERIADHATNIAEDVIFWKRGADVRHHLGTVQR